MNPLEPQPMTVEQVADLVARVDLSMLGRDPWPLALKAWARAYRAAFRAHPNLVPFLARGPARLCDALGLDLTHKGTDLVRGAVRLELDDPLPAAAISTGPRVGLRYAADRPWRFWITGDPTVSRYVPAAPRKRGSS